VAQVVFPEDENVIQTPDLLGRPLRGRVLGHIEVDDAAAMVGEHDEDEEYPQASGGHREEVEGDQVPDVVGEERPQV
jgi:hypothetical protein